MSQLDNLGETNDNVLSKVLQIDDISSYEKGIICEKFGNYGVAIQCLMRAIKEEPENKTKIWFLIAENCNRMGLHRETTVCLKNAGKENIIS